MKTQFKMNLNFTERSIAIPVMCHFYIFIAILLSQLKSAISIITINVVIISANFLNQCRSLLSQFSRLMTYFGEVNRHWRYTPSRLHSHPWNLARKSGGRDSLAAPSPSTMTNQTPARDRLGAVGEARSTAEAG